MRSRRLTAKQDALTTSGKRRQIYNFLKTSDLHCFKDVHFKTSGRCLIYVIFRTFGLQRLKDVWFALSWRRPICDILKTSDLQRLQNVWFMTSWRRPIYVVLKTSNLRRLEDVCKTTFVEERRSYVYTTSKEMVVSYFVLSEIFRKFFKCSSLS